MNATDQTHHAEWGTWKHRRFVVYPPDGHPQLRVSKRQAADAGMLETMRQGLDRARARWGMTVSTAGRALVLTGPEMVLRAHDPDGKSLLDLAREHYDQVHSLVQRIERSRARWRARTSLARQRRGTGTA